jgi:uncharacterized protein (DUF697 family)
MFMSPAYKQLPDRCQWLDKRVPIVTLQEEFAFMAWNQSEKDGRLTQAAFELVNAINKVTDENLPGKLAGIVKLHAGIGVGCVFVPVPGVDLLAATGNTWTMYVRINRELELPFRENFLKSIATGIVANLGSNVAVLAVLGLGSALKIMPGAGTIASYAVMSATVYAVTIAAGYVYMKALAVWLESKGEGPAKEEDFKAAVAEVMDDKDSIKSIIKSAKAGYKDTDSDLSNLAEELDSLKQEMQKKAVSSEQIDAVEEIAAAEMAARRNDVPRTFKRLKKSGNWSLETSEDLGLDVAIAALRTALSQ